MKTICVDEKLIVVECLETGNEKCCECSHYQNCHFVAHDSRGVLITALVSLALLVSAVVFLGAVLI